MPDYEKMTNIAQNTQNLSSMKSKEVIAELSERMGWTSKDITDVLAVMGSAIGTKLMEGDSINFPSLGQFEVRKKMERVSVNPTNGKRYLVPPKLVPVFKPANMIKGRLKDMDDNEQ